MSKLRRPKLGQHFLASPRFRQRIVEALRLRADDLVVEIGAGCGAMTGLLAERARRVVAIELDKALAEQLEEKFGSDSRFQILHADVLSVDLAEICRAQKVEECAVFGNLPYYITSPIIHHLLVFRAAIRAMALLLQREVAERLTARPGSRAYGYLSVLAQLYSQPRIVLGVPPGAFSPPPKVHSALVDFQMTPRFPQWSSQESEAFLEFVKHCFARKRKTLVNNLAGIRARSRVEQELSGLGLPANVRAEQLPLKQFKDLFLRLQ